MPRVCAVVIVAALTATAACAAKRAPAPSPAAGAAPTRTTVVLVPDENGVTGRVRVSTPSGSIELAEPFDSTLAATGKPPAPIARKSEAEVQREFGEVLAALPPPAERFVLYFRTDTTELTEESRALLPKVLRAVSARPVPEVTVIGHTDTTGSRAGNYRLGLDRAATVRTLLEAAGIDAALVETASHGEADLLVATRNNTAEPRNRRVEITVR